MYYHKFQALYSKNTKLYFKKYSLDFKNYKNFSINLCDFSPINIYGSRKFVTTCKFSISEYKFYKSFKRLFDSLSIYINFEKRLKRKTHSDKKRFKIFVVLNDYLYPNKLFYFNFIPVNFIKKTNWFIIFDIFNSRVLYCKKIPTTVKSKLGIVFQTKFDIIKLIFVNPIRINCLAILKK